MLLFYCLNVSYFGCCSKMQLMSWPASPCPSCVYCRGHHLPSVRLHISAGSHQPTPPSALITHQSPNESFLSATSHSSTCITTLCSFSVCSQTDFYCRESLRQRPLILRVCFKIKGTTGRHSCQVIWVLSQLLQLVFML